MLISNELQFWTQLSKFCYLQTLPFCFCFDEWQIWWPTTVTAKPKTSWLKQNSKIALGLPWVFAFAMGICFCREVFGFCCEVFGFAVRSLVLPWGFWFCREVVCFCHEAFGFAVSYFVFAVRFLVFAMTVVGHHRQRYESCMNYLYGHL